MKETGEDNPQVQRNCFVCNKLLPAAIGGRPMMPFNQPPSGGTCWTTSGNYGSELVDLTAGRGLPVRSDYLELTLCDDCLRPRLDRCLLVRPILSTRNLVESGDKLL